MSDYVVIKKTETRTAIASLCDDGIVRVLLKKNEEIGADDVKENYAAFKEITEGKYYCFLMLQKTIRWFIARTD